MKKQVSLYLLSLFVSLSLFIAQSWRDKRRANFEISATCLCFSTYLTVPLFGQERQEILKLTFKKYNSKKNNHRDILMKNQSLPFSCFSEEDLAPSERDKRGSIFKISATFLCFSTYLTVPLFGQE